MLLNLHVKNLALIQEADVYFGEGLNILTGETGAGKSIIIGSMNLALGEKIPKDLIRQDGQDAFVELVFAIDSQAQKEHLEALGIDTAEEQTVLTRRIMGGRSISRINGQTASAGLLKETAAVLLDMHGQHEHQSLLYKKKHLEILDVYGRQIIGPEKEKTALAYRRLKDAREQLDHFSMDKEQREREISFLEYEIHEIENAGLTEGEDQELEELYRKLSNAKKITEAVQNAHMLTGYEGDGAGELLGRACRLLSSVQEYDKELVSLCAQAEELDGLLNDLNRTLSSYRESMEFGEETFYNTEKRLDELNRLKTKYGGTISQVLDSLEQKKKRLLDLMDYEEKRRALESELDQAKTAYLKAAAVLTEKRKETAQRFTGAVREELADLNFLHVVFEMRFGVLEHGSANGMDDGEFLISTNPGEAVRPLASVASGGELSRIMLAIKTVLAEKDATGTLVFDEIDVGISGRTAQMVSEKMAKIAENHQVICITHLPQIAAMADTHFVIEKSVKDGGTVTGIRQLSREEIISELSRMLGGAQITDAVRNNALEMKRQAGAIKDKISRNDKFIAD